MKNDLLNCKSYTKKYRTPLLCYRALTQFLLFARITFLVVCIYTMNGLTCFVFMPSWILKCIFSGTFAYVPKYTWILIRVRTDTGKEYQKYLSGIEDTTYKADGGMF